MRILVRQTNCFASLLVYTLSYTCIHQESMYCNSGQVVGNIGYLCIIEWPEIHHRAPRVLGHVLLDCFHLKYITLYFDQQYKYITFHELKSC
jgi:hypothetical protein